MLCYNCLVIVRLNGNQITINTDDSNSNNTNTIDYIIIIIIIMHLGQYFFLLIENQPFQLKINIL